MLGMFKRVEVAPPPPKHVPAPPKMADEPTETEPLPVLVTSSCKWYDVQVEGSKEAQSGKHKGMFWVKVA
jgi:hypothetical protein